MLRLPRGRGGNGAPQSPCKASVKRQGSGQPAAARDLMQKWEGKTAGLNSFPCHVLLSQLAVKWLRSSDYAADKK